MVDITIVRQQSEPITEEDRMVLHRVIFGIVDGLGDVNKKRWRGFWRRVLKMEPGEMIELKSHQARLGWYHRKHFLFEQRLFEHQERFDNFKAFRDWMKVGAGHVDWYPGPKGGIIPVPRSISYAAMEQAEMEVFHANCIEFVRTAHAGLTLWKHLSVPQRIEMIEDVLAGCGAYQM